MTGFKINSSSDRDDEETGFSNAFESLFRYAKKETIKPIRGAGRWVVYGLGGTVLLSIGLVFGVMGLLRLIQSSRIGDSSSWSWTSYLITTFVCLGVFMFTKKRVRRGTLNKS